MTRIDPKALRDAFGSFMTGVTVVTTRTPDGTPLGFTANSFSSVSLDPPLLMVCPGKFLTQYENFAGSTCFAVNILAENQQGIATTFASFKGDRFANTPYENDALGSPLIKGALARFSCATHKVVDAGDHSILIGAIQSFDRSPGRGLGYVGGRFFSLGLERAALDNSGAGTLCGAVITRGNDVLLERTQSGFRPPQVVCDDHGHVRQNLSQHLAEMGQTVRLGPAYSVFDAGKTRCSYFLATAEGQSDTFEAVPIPEIPGLEFASQPIAAMMKRFALESQTRNFGLYVGDARSGDVHYSPERN